MHFHPFALNNPHDSKVVLCLLTLTSYHLVSEEDINFISSQANLSNYLFF